MIYLRNFNSHSDYETAESTLLENTVSYDKEHVHFKPKTTEESDDEEEPEATKYALAVNVNDTDFGEISTYDYEYAENDTINTNIEHMSIVNFETTIYKTDTNEDITSTSPITVTTYKNGFTITGTMPNYNVKININVSSLA